MIALRPNVGQLHLTFAFQGRFGKGRAQQDVYEQIESARQVRAQHLRARPETVSPAVAVDAAAE